MDTYEKKVEILINYNMIINFSRFLNPWFIIISIYVVRIEFYQNKKQINTCLYF